MQFSSTRILRKMYPTSNKIISPIGTEWHHSKEPLCYSNDIITDTVTNRYTITNLRWKTQSQKYVRDQFQSRGKLTVMFFSPNLACTYASHNFNLHKRLLW